MSVHHRTVRQETRQQIAKLLPGLGDNQVYWRMISALLLNGSSYRAGGRPYLSHKKLSTITGIDYSHLNSGELLAAFKRDVVPDIEWTDWQAPLYGTPGLAREIIWDVPESLQEVLQEELSTIPTDRRVYVDTGLSWSPARRGEDVVSMRTLSQSLAVGALTTTTARLLTYMNGLPSNIFSKAWNAHRDEAYAVAETLAPATRDSALRVLGSIFSVAQPFYQPAAHSVRVFGIGDTLLGLPREVRAVLTQDWHTLDLRASQLAITARLWNVESVQEMLRTGTNLWQVLLASMDIPAGMENTVKNNVLKHLVYGLLYGASKATLLENLQQDSAAFNLVLSPDILKHPVLQEMMVARNHQLRLIRDAGGALDAYGNWLPMKGNPRSILAQVAQSHELYILEPVLELAETSHDVRITTWLHDGVTINLRRREEEYIKRAVETVQERCNAIGVYTELSVEY